MRNRIVKTENVAVVHLDSNEVIDIETNPENVGEDEEQEIVNINIQEPEMSIYVLPINPPDENALDNN